LLEGSLDAGGGNYPTVRGDGTPGWIEVRSRRMTWQGRPALLGMVQDVTDRIRLEDELREAHKMEAVGQLAGGIAHDFNNLMTAILCHANLLKANARTAENRDTADTIEKAARRAAELTSQLLGFARRGKHQDVPVDLSATIQSVIRLASSALNPRIHIDTQLPAESVFIRGDPAQMEQVVLNLAVNARDAMPDGGRLTFALETVDLGPGHGHAKAGRYVLLRVSDTGCGIPEDVRPHIFEPFFTTKPQGKGTGMGLAMVYGIARNHGGWVEVESEVGRGATFSVYLPVCDGPAADDLPGHAAVASAEEGRPATGRILVVDDDEMVRNVVTRMLTGLGYSVECAAGCREAVALYAANPGNVDLVIIDLVMPDQDGRECFRAMRQIDPDVRAILCTGAGSDAATQDALAEGMAGFIRKPYQLDQLAAAIQRALAAPQA
jgi:signal transduction histidine kinase/CheY-like chemotaxis protein